MTAAPGADEVSGLSYGWVIAAALAVSEAISWGILYYSFPVFLRAMQTDLGVSQVAITGALSAALAVSALAAVPVGWWLDRHGPRALMTAGSCLATVTLLVWSRVGGLAGLYAVWCMMGLAMAMTLYEPAFAAVVQWFPSHRDRALLVVTLVGGLASTIFMPVAAWLLVRVGWRTAVEALAALLAATTIPLHALVLRPAPRDVSPGRRDEPPGRSDVPLRAAVTTAAFWVLAIAFAVSSFIAVAVSVHGIPFLTQHGYSATRAAALVGWMGAMQLPGRLCVVPVARWWGAARATASIFLAQGAGMALLASAVRLPILVPVILFVGAANGMSTLARATTVAELFGRRSYGSVNGAIGLGASAARALGPVGTSLLVAWLGGYERAFLVVAGAMALAGSMLIFGQTATAVHGAKGGAP